MTIFDKLNQVAKDLSGKTSDAIEAAKLSARVGSERSAAGEDLKKIGRYYYDLYIQTGEAAEEVADLCASAKAHFDAADNAKAEVARIKASFELERVSGTVCPNCGSNIAAGANFCPSCGIRLDAKEPLEAELVTEEPIEDAPAAEEEAICAEPECAEEAPEESAQQE